jgi:hypothetical protein
MDEKKDLKFCLFIITKNNKTKKDLKYVMKTKMIISDFRKSFSSFVSRFLGLNENGSDNWKNKNDYDKNNRKRKLCCCCSTPVTYCKWPFIKSLIKCHLKSYGLLPEQAQQDKKQSRKGKHSEEVQENYLHTIFS